MLRIAVCVVSIHAFRGEGDCLQETEQPVFPSFQSTPSGGKATILHNAVFARFMFQSTPSGGKATQGFKAERAQMQEFQSTPSGGKATRRGKRMIAQTPHVSIHAFRGEGDTGSTGVSLALCVFQSTPSGGKATPQYLGLLCPVPARYCSMIRIFRVALGTICPYIRFLRCC